MDGAKELLPLTFHNSNVLLSANTDFISKWSTFISGSTNSTSIKLPLESTGNYNFQVDWGDGNSSTISEYDQADVVHNYALSGTYTIIIFGTLIGWSFKDGGDSTKIIEISQWGNVNLGNSTGYFDYCTNLVLTATDAPDLTGTTTLANAFRDAAKLGNTGSFAAWDVSEVTDMSRLFYKAADFNMSLNSWDVSKVTDMSFLFYRASDYNQPMDAWNVSSVTTMEDMFGQAVNFNQSINSWDVSSVTSMYRLFATASNFNQELSDWDVSKVTDMRSVFVQATAFNKSINTWNTSSVTNMAQMFWGATSFNQPLNNLDVSNVLFMERQFRGAVIFNRPLNSWNVTSVTLMTEMFRDASAFNQPLDQWNVSSVTSLMSMFYLATAFDQNIGSWQVEKLQYASQMFRYATLSPQNYGSLLMTWSILNLKSNVYFHGGYSQYLNEALPARQILTDTYLWTIDDGGITSLPEVSHPADVNYIVGTTLNTIQWTVGVSSPDVYNITLDGNIYATTQSWTNGTITQNIDGLTIGSYEFIIYLYDTDGKMNYDSVTVTVEEAPDTFKPEMSSPLDAEYFYGASGIFIRWSVSDPNPGTYNVTRNGTLYKNSETWDNGFITLDIVDLDVGIHEFILYVYDLNGNRESDSVIVTIKETPDVTKPDISNPIDPEYTYGTSGISITWSLGDVNPGTYNVTKNGTLYTNNQLWSNGTISVDIVGLAVGNHEFIIYVYDLNGNKASDSVIVTIAEVQTGTTSVSSSTSTSTSPSDTSTSTTTQTSTTTSSSENSEGDSSAILVITIIFGLVTIGFAIFMQISKKY